jgi:uncharacterized Zn-binding protein involved in type VI secretion
MGLPAAKQDDRILANDHHFVTLPNGAMALRDQHKFDGPLGTELSRNVFIQGMAAATVGSIAKNAQEHPPTPPGTGFVSQPSNLGKISEGSKSVFINHNGAARDGDPAETCNEPTSLPPVGKVKASGTVYIG